MQDTFLNALRGALFAAVGVGATACGGNENKEGDNDAAPPLPVPITDGGADSVDADAQNIVPECKSPRPIVRDGGVETGLEQCANGPVRRKSIVACAAPTPDPRLATCTSGCFRDSECIERP